MAFNMLGTPRIAPGIIPGQLVCQRCSRPMMNMGKNAAHKQQFDCEFCELGFEFDLQPATGNYVPPMPRESESVAQKSKSLGLAFVQRDTESPSRPATVRRKRRAKK